MRPVCCPVLIVLIALPAPAFAQDTAAPIDRSAQPTAAPSSVAPEAVAFDLADLPQVPASREAGVQRDCIAQPVLPGDDPGIVVCGRRERNYASVAQNYDKGGWAEPPLPPADPTTLTTGSCVQITCLPPPAVNGFSVLDGLYKIGKKIIEGE